MARKSNRGYAKLATVLIVLLAGGVLGLMNMPHQAAASVEYANETAKAVTDVKAPVVTRIEDVLTKLDRGEQLADELVEAQTNPDQLKAKVDELNQLATEFRAFANDKDSLRAIVGGGISSIESVTGKIERDADDARKVQTKLEQDARAQTSPEAKEGKLKAAKLAGDRAALWDAFAGSNSTAQDQLKSYNADLQRLAELADANADVYEQAALNATLSSSMRESASILRTSAGADVDRLAKRMRETWDNLDKAVSTMTSDAQKLAQIDNATK
ncbi:MAG: hypothetical protein HZC36_08220 [Armatimonadetes bacterium]|nr:hypothetical protein [Armatimonadota bacterium]